MTKMAQKALTAATLALCLTGATAVSAYSIFERNDYLGDDSDPSNDYGDISVVCANGTGFTVRYQSDSRGRLYFTDLENQSSDENIVIKRECGE